MNQEAIDYFTEWHRIKVVVVLLFISQDKIKIRIKNMSKSTLLTVGIILLVIGLIGVFAGYAVTWMWVVAILGLIGILWGWLSKGKGGSSQQ
jgi:cadmium resistance protein CadD (predicted permease)